MAQARATTTSTTSTPHLQPERYLMRCTRNAIPKRRPSFGMRVTRLVQPTCSPMSANEQVPLASPFHCSAVCCAPHPVLIFVHVFAISAHNLRLCMCLSPLQLSRQWPTWVTETPKSDPSQSMQLARKRGSARHNGPAPCVAMRWPAPPNKEARNYPLHEPEVSEPDSRQENGHRSPRGRRKRRAPTIVEPLHPRPSCASGCEARRATRISNSRRSASQASPPVARASIIRWLCPSSTPSCWPD